MEVEAKNSDYAQPVTLRTLYPELTEKQAEMFEFKIAQKIEFNRLKKIVYERFAVV